MFLHWNNQYCENDYTTQSNLQVQYNLYQITNAIFHRARTKKFTIHMEKQESNSQSNFEKEKWSCRNQSSLLQTILQSYSHQDSSVQFSCSVVSDSVIPWTSGHRASLSITNSQSLLKLMSVKLVMPSNHLILVFDLFLYLAAPGLCFGMQDP